MSGERVDRHKNGRACNRFGLDLGAGIYWCPTVFARLPACVSVRGTQEMKFKWDFPHCPLVQVQVRSPDREACISTQCPVRGPDDIDLLMVVRPLVWLCRHDVLRLTHSPKAAWACICISLHDIECEAMGCCSQHRRMKSQFTDGVGLTFRF